MNYYFCKRCSKYMGNKKKVYCSGQCSLKPMLGRRKLFLAVRRAVFTRSNGKCEECYKTGEAIHHIISVRERPDLQQELDNLIHLCTDCHQNKHPNLPSILFEHNRILATKQTYNND